MEHSLRYTQDRSVRQAAPFQKINAGPIYGRACEGKHEKSSRTYRRPECAKEFRANHDYSLPRSEAHSKKAKERNYNAQIQEGRQRLERLSRPRLCRRVMWRVALSGQIAVRQSSPYN